MRLACSRHMPLVHAQVDTATADALRGYDRAKRMAEIIADKWNKMKVRAGDHIMWHELSIM